ncbi:adenosine deaminase [Clostridium polyendosporum]|uniref:Adenosine deaminase n=1 Tax=Clostridium polyendosporum TaxID=69208 RepID=A0A919RX77_9CLOT|nr:adenosine deaminase [Clostridium polyendosporum]GIM27431.1 adenosine deaminase [Clostridium polyendosporum]
MDIQERIRNLPKVHLHCHLDGSVRPETLMEIALKENIPLPAYELEELKEHIQVQNKCLSLKEYLKKFVYPISVMQKKEYLKRIAFELIEDCSIENIRYVEIRFAPYLHISQGLSEEDVIEAVLQGIKEGEEKFRVHSNIIISFLRHETIDKNLHQLQAAAKYLGKGVVAVDLAGNEDDYPPELFIDLFNKSKVMGFHITIHAGETGIAENIEKSIRLLHAERIGHGVSAIKDSNIMKLLKEKNIPLEVCVTSNYNTEIIENINDHPIKQFYDRDIKVTVSTDNNTVSNVTLTYELCLLNKSFKFTVEDIINIIKNGIEASFCNDELKKKLLKELSQF